MRITLEERILTISAKIIKDSISKNGQRIATFELEYPRIVHSEFMTHRIFSRNAASSRAIPISKMIEQVIQEPAQPVEWGLNQSGMQAKKLHKYPTTCELAWKNAAKSAAEHAEVLKDLGLHKQVVNRVLEPYQTMKTILTATSYDNYYWLRCHSDADPTIKVLADEMYKAFEESKPELLMAGEWHLPYVDCVMCEVAMGWSYSSNGVKLTLEEAKKVSASCCAQVSYRLLDTSLDKALKIYDMLVTMSPVHSSPFEHLATPMEELSANRLGKLNPYNPEYWEEGVTHMDKDGKFHSGNFKGWVQYRQLIDGNVCNNYEG